PDLFQRFVLGPTEPWAWFGIWQDRNGNGAIDHEQNLSEPGSVSARNEFVWLGGCLDLSHTPRTGTPYCHRVDNARIAGFVWPGNHHASCGGGTVAGLDPVLGCSTVPADVPGLQAYCLAQEGLAEQLPQGVANALFDAVSIHGCGNQPEALEQDSGALYGDPLFENPIAKRPDFYYDDRTGEPDIEARHWVAGQGFPVYFYDNSLLGTTTFLAVEGASFAATPQTIDLASAPFIDVDIDRAWNPAAENALQGVLKPVVQSVWLSNREQVVATFNTGSAIGRGATLDASPVLGPVQAERLDPGFAHEPDDARDVAPGAAYEAYGLRTHEGFTNDYAGYAQQPRGWLDAQAVRVMTDNLGWQLPEPSGDVLSQCLVCTGGPGLTSALNLLAARGAGEHSRSLDPGVYTWAGHVGLWQDRVQHRIEESVDLDPADLRFNFSHFYDGPDGWVGNVVNATGAFLYRGYANETCTVRGVEAVYPFAWCHPTKDGSLSDPNDYGTASLEWTGQCVSSQNLLDVVLEPAGGVWSVPTVVIHNLDNAPPTDPSAVTVWTGVADNPDTPQNEAALPLHIRCDDVLLGTFHASDYLLLPEGNLGLPITQTTAGQVQRLDGGLDQVQDVDAYVAAAPP
ncbi:MAG: hypothetical protein LC624_10515, partial [Halobacteriales archaeon]|nr:hypothetical protein [Halobacteriales archaeon]